MINGLLFLTMYKIRGSNSNLTLKEIFENDMHLLENVQKIDKTKFELAQNNSEIKDEVIEVTKKHENNYIIEDAEAELQKNFRTFFKYKKK